MSFLLYLDFHSSFVTHTKNVIYKDCYESKKYNLLITMAIKIFLNCVPLKIAWGQSVARMSEPGLAWHLSPPALFNLFLVEVWLNYIVVMITVIQKTDSVKHTYALFFILFSIRAYHRMLSIILTAKKKNTFYFKKCFILYVKK